MRNTITSLMLAMSAVGATNQALSSDVVHDAPAFSAGVVLGTFGIGGQFSGNTNWHFNEQDRVQWRVLVASFNGDEDDADIDIADIEYDNVDLDLFGTQIGIDWFPFVDSGSLSRKMFFSGGLSYYNNDYSLTPDTSRSYFVGTQAVRPTDNTRIRTDVEQSTIAPYFSVGWGNAIADNKGFSFFAEAGVLLPFSDPDVTVSEQGGNLIPASELEEERRQIEDELDGAQFLFNIGLGSHF